MRSCIVNPRKFNWRNLPQCPHPRPCPCPCPCPCPWTWTRTGTWTWTWTFFPVDVLSHLTFFLIRSFYIWHFVLFGVFPFDVLSRLAFFPFNVFSIQHFVPFGLLSHSSLVPFNVLYNLAFFPFDVLSHSAFCLSTFCRSTFCPFGVCYFDILSVNREFMLVQLYSSSHLFLKQEKHCLKIYEMYTKLCNYKNYLFHHLLSALASLLHPCRTASSSRWAASALDSSLPPFCELGWAGVSCPMWLQNMSHLPGCTHSI